jgi:hypothetical protein
MLNFLLKWKSLIITKRIKNKKKEKIKIVNNSESVYNRLYENYKYKKSYLEALKICYIIKEGEEISFQPKVNKTFLPFNYNSDFLKIQNLKKFQRIKNKLSLSDSKNYGFKNYFNKKNSDNNRKNSYTNDKDNNNNIISNSNKNSFKLLNSYSNFDFGNRNYFSGLSTNNQSIKEKILFDYDNHLQIKKPIEKNNYIQNSYSILDDELSIINQKNNLFPNNTTNSNSKKPFSFRDLIKYKKKNILFNNLNDYTSLHDNYYNNDDDDDDKISQNPLIENSNINNSINDNKINNIMKKSNSVNMKNNILNSNRNNDYRMTKEQFSIKAIYPQSSHVTLQSMSDTMLMQVASNYVNLNSDSSFE